MKRYPKKGIAHIGEKNKKWKGSKVGYGSLHSWVRRWLPKPSLCQECELVPPFVVANKSQLYKRDLSDWEWLCVHCHMVKYKMAAGEKNCKAKLTNGKVQKIRQLFDTGLFTKQAIADIYGVRDATIGFIIRRETWKHI